MEAIEKLKRLDRRLALLALLTLRGVKPVSRVDGFEGPDEAVAALLREIGLKVEVSKSGCKTDILFGRELTGYHKTETLRGTERVMALGKLFGYPECCSRFFADFMTGDAEGKPEKKPPLEHFVCPGCRESARLLEKYKELEKELFPEKRDSDQLA